MSVFLTRVAAVGVYDRFDLFQEFRDGINILHGRNGAGKTTLLHILTNILNGDYERFAFLEFKEIRVDLSDQTTVLLSRHLIDEQNCIVLTVNGVEEASFKVEEKIESLRNEYVSLEEAERRPYRAFRPYPRTAFIETDYFPAFRTLLEGWKQPSRFALPFSAEAEAVLTTLRARSLFGEFVPRVRYPSPHDIRERLQQEVQLAQIDVGEQNKELLSQAFRDIFVSLKTSPNEQLSSVDLQPAHLLEEIQGLLKELEGTRFASESTQEFSSLRHEVLSFEGAPGTNYLSSRVLLVYKDALTKILSATEEAFSKIERYLSSVNRFLEDKQVEIITRSSSSSSRRPMVSLRFDERTSDSFEALSSGERQIVTLLYAATHMDSQRLILIDEPEISLDVAWQRSLLGEMTAQLPNKQIIACTHSPMVAAEYRNRMISLEPKRTTTPA